MIAITQSLFLLILAATTLSANPVTTNQSVKQDLKEVSFESTAKSISKPLFNRIDSILQGFESRSTSLLGNLSLSEKGNNDDKTIKKLLYVINNALKEYCDESQQNFLKDLSALSKLRKQRSDLLDSKVDDLFQKHKLRSLFDLKEKWIKLKEKITELIQKAEVKFEEVKKRGSDTLQITLKKWEHIKKKTLKLVDEAKSTLIEIDSVIAQTYQDIKNLFKNEKVEI